MTLRHAALLAAGLLAAGAAAPPPADAQQGGRLTVGLSQYPANFNPNIESMAAKSWVLYAAHRPLTTFDADWNLVCELCEELPSVEKGTAEIVTRADGTRTVRTTFTLRADAVWGDGTPVTTKDVLFSWEVGRNPQSGFANNDLWTRRIAAIEARDDRTFTIERDTFACGYDNLSDFRIIPEHVEGPVYRAAPDAYRNRSAYETDTANPGLYNGPYRIAAVDRGASVTLVPNAAWRGDPPPFREIVVRAVENLPALEANLLSRDLDYVAGELGLSLEQVTDLQRRMPDRFRYVYRPGLIYEHITPNLENPILADVRVRRALLHAVDRHALTQELFDGRQPVATTSINPLDRVFSDGARGYGHDPAEAVRLLEEAGWTAVGPDRVRRNAAGQRLSFEFMTTAGNTTRELVQQVLQAQWAEVGIETVIRNEPPRVFFGQTVRERRYTGLALFAWISSPENPPRTILHSTQIPTAENGWGGQNTNAFRSGRIDRILDDLLVTCPPGDPEPRRRLWAELQEAYAEELPALPLYFRVDPFAIPQSLPGLTPTGHQYMSTLSVEGWGRPAAR
jgi:peptide/nickel transport system substrate-binding protein